MQTRRGKEGEAAGQSERDVNWAFARSLALRDAAQRVARALRGGGRTGTCNLSAPARVGARAIKQHEWRDKGAQNQSNKAAIIAPSRPIARRGI